MRYVSTRGEAPILEFGDTLLTGLASDGGLYVPERWPALDAGALAPETVPFPVVAPFRVRVDLAHRPPDDPTVFRMLQQADTVGAHTSLVEALTLARRLGNTFGLYLALEGLAGLDAVRRQPERALRLAGAVSAGREATGTAMAAHWQVSTDRWIERARRQLSPPSAEAAWDQGRQMSLEQAIEAAFAASEPLPPSVTSPGGSVLTPRQWEIGSLVTQGLTNRQIAERLVVSERTVDGHLERIRNRLGVRSRAQIAAWWVEQTSPKSPERRQAHSRTV